LTYGAPNGDSIDNNLTWLKYFSSQIEQGELYPRWLMDMNLGAGSPVFYYYFPLPFYIASIPVLLLPNSPLIVQLAWGEWVLLSLSGLTFLFFAQRRATLGAAVVASAVYMLLPYHFEIDLWHREDVGEVTAYIWIPLILHYADELFEKNRAVIGLSVSYALLVLSHLPCALLLSICILGYVLAGIKGRFSTRYLLRLSAGIVLGLMLAGLYWIPAVFSLHYVRSEWLWNPGADFHLWLYPGDDLLKTDARTWTFVQRLFDMAILSTVMYVIGTLAIIRQWKHIDKRWLFRPAALVAIAWFLMLPISTFVWEHAPLLSRVQFPWRVIISIEVATGLVTLYALELAATRRDKFAGAAAAISLALLAYALTTADFSQYLEPYFNQRLIAARDGSVEDGFETAEYTPIWNTQEPVLKYVPTDTDAASRRRPKVSYDSSIGTVTLREWAPRRIRIDVQQRKAGLLTVGQFYFPNWRAEAKGGTQLSIRPSNPEGLVQIDLPPGTYQVKLRLKPLPQEWIGGSLSLAGLFLLIGLAIIFHRTTTSADPPAHSNPRNRRRNHMK
jgi:hypothetical protein